jgi:LacI family transcriptional regulator
VFAVHEIVAIAPIRAAQAQGRRVPEDRSVIAYDDIELAQHISPGLTTMRVDKVAMGRLAVHLIRNRIEFPDSERVVTVVKPRLVERGSVATAGCV